MQNNSCRRPLPKRISSKKNDRSDQLCRFFGVFLPLLVLVPCEIGHHLCSGGGGVGSNKSRYDDCEYYPPTVREGAQF